MNFDFFETEIGNQKKENVISCLDYSSMGNYARGEQLLTVGFISTARFLMPANGPPRQC